MAATQIQADVIARRVGASPAVIDKRPGDMRPYVIDLQQLMLAGEIALSVGEVLAPGLQIGRVRTRGGLYLELQIGGGESGKGGEPRDYPVTAPVTTSRGALQVELDVRVHPR